VRIVPAGLTHDMELAVANGTAALTLEGALDDSVELAFKLELDKVVAARPAQFVLRMQDLQTMSDMALVYSPSTPGVSISRQRSSSSGQPTGSKEPSSVSVSWKRQP
jgi:hypothetical protein